MKRFLLLTLMVTTLKAADSCIVGATNAFTLDAYQHLARNDDNLIASPFNIATALSMVLVGARRQTAEQIQSVLHLQCEPTGFGKLLTDLTTSGNAGGSELLTANGLWVQRGFAILPAFEETLEANYQATATPVDFITASEAARSQINRWTEEHTKEKIKDLFPVGTLDARTRLVLTTAIYFYGKWQVPFVTSRTRPAPFTRVPGETTQASFMNQTSRFGYTETSSAQLLEMRYAATGIAFDILLPKAVTGLAGVENSLTKENLAAWLGNLSTRNVQVSLPKFRVESAFSLGKQLSMMGMPAAFTDKADFSGISPVHGLAIAQVIHKAFVDVSEQGTEAAAATGISATLAAVHEPTQLVVFRADHPFLFLIRDTRSRAVLFIGRMMNPR